VSVESRLPFNQWYLQEDGAVADTPALPREGVLNKIKSL
jgi:hypothetical protein